MYDESAASHEFQLADIAEAGRKRSQTRPSPERGRILSSTSYRAKLGRETIALDAIAFRILTFLSATPYHAYSRRRIAEAVTSRRHPVAEETLDDHIRALREQLGFFRDYVQTVPYIGYRFRA
jgi:DNA-binding response OmpR family regulator